MVLESESGKFLRTVLTKETYDRLTTFAQQYINGLGKWDYGIAIQVLLDFFEQHSTVAQINGKLDLLLSLATQEVPEEPKQEEESGTEMLGGEVIRK